MSTVEEDTELRDLVAQTLEKNGCLARLRAELRASIFLALEEDIKLNKQQPLQNLRVQSYLETSEGRTMFCLVREFLEFFNLQFTISVYESESYLDSIYEGRQKTAKDLGLEHIDESTVPLLQQLLKIAQTRNKVLDINLNVDNNINGSFKDESLNADNSYKKTESEYASTEATLNDILSENNEESNSVDKSAPIMNIIKSEYTSQAKNTDRSENVKEKSKKDKSELMPDMNKSSEILNLETVTNFSIHNDEKENYKANDLNQTFDVKSPIISHNDNQKKHSGNLDLHRILKNIHEDDTYEDTSSITDDSEIPAISSLKVTELTVNSVPQINLSDMSLNETHTSIKSKVEHEKLKSSPQRPKTTLNCLSDLPPISISNKSKISNEILPSLYNKDFKDKSNLKELDKIFDMEVEYEEDFICSSNDISYTNSSLHSAHSKNGSAHQTNKSQLFSATETLLNSENVLSDKLKSFKQSQRNCTDDAENSSSFKEHSLSD